MYRKSRPDIEQERRIAGKRAGIRIVTAAFADFLKAQDMARLLACVNYREMSQMRVYAMPMGPGPDAEYEEELRQEVAVYFPRLRDYVAAAAERHDGLLLWVS